MQVHVVGDDPVREAVVAALDDVDIGVRDAEPSSLSDARFAVVSDVAGSATFDQANEAARSGGTPWIAVEIGGIGGHPLSTVDAAISGFAPATGCFDCLRARVASNLEERADAPQADRAGARLAGAIAGRECVRVLSGDERSIIGQVREVPHARREFLPVPGCACAEESRDRSLERDAETLGLDAAVERAERAIDDRVGPVSSIAEVESFPAPYYLATVAETTAFSDASAPRQAAGVADDWNAALMKAVGEGLERYCAGVYRDAEFVRASEDDLENAVAPADLVRPDDTPAYDSGEEHRWVPGEALETGEPTHLPAAAVQFPQPGASLVPAITTGLGLGSSTVDALVSGLTEVIERDATMLAWYSTFEPLGLSVETDAFATLERRARSEGLSVTPLLVTQDIDVPVVAVASIASRTRSRATSRFRRPTTRGRLSRSARRPASTPRRPRPQRSRRRSKTGWNCAVSAPTMRPTPVARLASTRRSPSARERSSTPTGRFPQRASVPTPSRPVSTVSRRCVRGRPTQG